ncbi:DMT family transporter [Fundidesulfovibrio putealis]|uniref:DMT family transporter n=1 Tax=Fundidesulfovibrio putealis TaxID=270496 RepID=UPI00041EFCEC|nr:EamA family transporter [Fundidesulfovibrio putealis]
MRGYVEGLAVVGFWTAFMLVSRIGLTGASGLTPWDMLALRLATASVVLAPFCGDMGREVWTSWRLWLLALVGGLGYGILVYWGFRLAPATHGAVLFPGMLPFWTAGLGWLLLRSRPGGSQWAGYALIAAGMVFMTRQAFSGQNDSDTLTGDFLLLASSLTWALYGVLAKRWGFPPWLLTRFLALAPAVLYLPVYAVALPRNLEAAGLGRLAFQGVYHGVVTTIVVMWLYLRAQERLGPARLGALLAVVPALSGTLAALYLGEDMTAGLAAALALVSCGAWLAARGKTETGGGAHALCEHQDHPGGSLGGSQGQADRGSDPAAG